jgi:hypothetical protein
VDDARRFADAAHAPTQFAQELPHTYMLSSGQIYHEELDAHVMRSFDFGQHLTDTAVTLSMEMIFYGEPGVLVMPAAPLAAALASQRGGLAMMRHVLNCAKDRHKWVHLMHLILARQLRHAPPALTQSPSHACIIVRAASVLGAPVGIAQIIHQSKSVCAPLGHICCG